LGADGLADNFGKWDGVGAAGRRGGDGGGAVGEVPEPSAQAAKADAGVLDAQRFAGAAEGNAGDAEFAGLAGDVVGGDGGA